MRILTQDIINMHPIPICASGQEFVDGANATGQSLIGKTPEEVMLVARGEELPEEVAWWKMLFRMPEVIRAFGDVKIESYRVIGHSDEPQMFATMEEALNAHNAFVSKWREDNAHIVSTVVSTPGADGNTVWKPVDLEQYEPVEGEVLKVFNAFTGIYEDFNSVDAAKVRALELYKLFEKQAHHSCTIEQLISNEYGDKAWEPVIHDLTPQ